jgi:hypothetical protein
MDLKDVYSFRGLYGITESGEVFSHRSQIVIKPRLKKNGYLSVKLCDSGKAKHLTVHRLVALHYVPNPLGLPEVNHIDGDKLNNHFKNLEWVTSSENQKHAFRLGLQKAAKGKDHAQSIAVIQKDLSGNFVKEWESIKQIKREIGFNSFGIIKCCKKEKKYKTAYGYLWEYKE